MLWKILEMTKNLNELFFVHEEFLSSYLRYETKNLKNLLSEPVFCYIYTFRTNQGKKLIKFLLSIIFALFRFSYLENNGINSSNDLKIILIIDYRPWYAIIIIYCLTLYAVQKCWGLVSQWRLFLIDKIVHIFLVVFQYHFTININSLGGSSENLLVFLGYIVTFERAISCW